MRPCLKLNSMKVDGDRVYRIDHGTQADAAGKQSRRRALTLVDYRSISKQISTVSRAIYLDGLESGTTRRAACRHKTELKWRPRRLASGLSVCTENSDTDVVMQSSKEGM